MILNFGQTQPEIYFSFTLQIPTGWRGLKLRENPYWGFGAQLFLLYAENMA
jgi:hypothetical protein